MTTHIYCDYTNGNDSTGNGSSGNPYKTLQKCIDVAVGSDPAHIHVANTSAQILAAPITWNTGWTSGTGGDTPLVIESWNNGGSITITHPEGNLVAAEIDGNDAISSLFNGTGSTPNFVILKNLKLHGTTSAVVNVGSNTGWTFINCEFYDCAGTYMFDSGTTGQSHIYGCIFRDGAGTAALRQQVSAAQVYFSYFYNNTIAILANCTHGLIMGNVIEVPASGKGIEITSDHVKIIGNTIYGAKSSDKGINVSTSSIEFAVILNNMIAHCATGIDYVAGSNSLIVGHNAFYDNTTNINGKTVVEGGVDLTANDISETSNPFTNAASHNYSIVSGALSKGKGYPQGIVGTATLSSPDIGASHSNAQGGGSYGYGSVGQL